MYYIGKKKRWFSGTVDLNVREVRGWFSQLIKILI